MEDLKKIEKNLKKIKFYPTKNITPLQQSPTMSIKIKFKDGSRKVIDMVEERVLISCITKDDEILSNFYYVNPWEVRLRIEENITIIDLIRE